jgi:hypothetical protein
MEQMALMNRLNAHLEPADRGMTNWGMCVKYPSVKVLNIVTWRKHHTLVSMPNDEDEEERGNKQDNNDEEERWSKQNNNEEEERWSNQDNDEGVHWEFHEFERGVGQKEEEGEQHKNVRGMLLDQSYDDYLHVHRYFPCGVSYSWYQHKY